MYKLKEKSCLYYSNCVEILDVVSLDDLPLYVRSLRW